MANTKPGFVQILGQRKAAKFRKLALEMARDIKSPTARNNADIRATLRRLRDNLGALADLVDPPTDEDLDNL